ncbi:hypothetical protein [Pseudomonas putida]|uniref:hypothetical protein n=1 Tax=Pseudomonas putida TaxID=303 RepID=UPI001F527739|nr:hypothetical protein [Pseudomonas putida]MCI1037729.1 hypothetical protein [Pseudomonas putida]
MQSSTSQPLVDWRPGCPIPFADCEDERDPPPDELTHDDVQLIWWSVASSFTHDELKEKLLSTLESTTDWGGFVYSPIAEVSGRGRYPWPVITLLQEMMRPGVISSVDQEGDETSGVYGMVIIQIQIWHELTWRALDICPVEVLPEHLLEHRLERDLGM